MINKDDRMLEEAYEEMNEGFMDKMKARKGNTMQNLGGKAMGKVGNFIGGKAGGTLQKAGGEMQTASSDSRAEHITNNYKEKFKQLMGQYQKDVISVTGAPDLGVVTDEQMNELMSMMDTWV